jgi:hypothetical protein
MKRQLRPDEWLIRGFALAASVGVALGARAAERDARLGDWRELLEAPLQMTQIVPDDPFADDAESCPPGSWCEPFRIPNAPLFSDARTTLGGVEEADRYACDLDVDASGPEVVYELELEVPTLLRASVDSPEFVDVDLQLLTGLGEGGCRSRGDARLQTVLSPGHYWLVVDTYVDRTGEVLAGAYRLDVRQTPLPDGRCTMTPRRQAMYWPACADGFDCRDQRPDDRDIHLRMPAFGPVAREAHLATTADFAWPMAPTEGLTQHYRSTERASGYAMPRKEPWAPSPVGGPYARGSTGALVPPIAETWYANMFWKDKPLPGERMILYNPLNGRAVVAAGGYETGPRAHESLGGASEEVHHALGTRHLDEVVMGFAADQSLPYGPIDCDD